MDTNDWQSALGLLGLVITLGIAIVGWAFAVRADRRAKDAGDRADEALELARSAEARADRLEQISAERRDVVWRLIDARRDTVSAQNIGRDTAQEVVLTVDFEEAIPRQTTRLPRVEPTARIGVNLTTAIADELERQRREIATSLGYIGVPTVHGRVRLSWQSDLGVHDTVDLGEVAF